MNKIRSQSELSTLVDEAILLYESGSIEQAMRMLSSLGFKACDVHRILLEPDNRRKYINDMVSGY